MTRRVLVVDDDAAILEVLEMRLSAMGFEYLESDLDPRDAAMFTRLDLRSTIEGLESIEVGRFDTYVPLLQLPRPLRGIARRLARTDAFAPMYYGAGTRPGRPVS